MSLSAKSILLVLALLYFSQATAIKCYNCGDSTNQAKVCPEDYKRMEVECSGLCSRTEGHMDGRSLFVYRGCLIGPTRTGCVDSLEGSTVLTSCLCNTFLCNGDQGAHRAVKVDAASHVVPSKILCVGTLLIVIYKMLAD